MACSITIKGIAAECKNSMGGIKAVWMAPYEKDAATVENGSVTISATNFKRFNTRKNVSSMTSTATIDATNGTNYMTNELVMVFARMDADKRIELNTLINGDMMAVVADSNGEYWFLGKDEPVNVTAATAQTGTAKADGNNYNFTFTDESLELPYPLAEASKAAFDAIV